MKDNFSSNSDQYVTYRPLYSDAIFAFIYQHLPHRRIAWDCGTGNGQVAVKLAQTFKTVFATDMSKNQIQHAIQRENIRYSVQPAEKTTLPQDTFDLIMVAQAIHWFNFTNFYHEVRRVANHGCRIAVIGYGRARITPQVDAVVDELYYNLTDPYWDPERRYIDEGYRTIPFPFDEIPTPPILNQVNWTSEHFMGYLNTWSGVKHFEKAKNQNPVDIIRAKLESAWGNSSRTVSFPLLFRLGMVQNK